MLRKEACSRGIHDLAHIPTNNFLADCVTEASANADTLITAMKTVKLVDVDKHPDFITLMEHTAFLSTWCRTLMHTREKFLNTLKIPLAPTSQEGPFQVMFAGTQQQKKQKKLNTSERKGQDATKITSAFADSCIRFLWSVMPIPMAALNTIEEFTEEIDEARFVKQYNLFHFLIRMLCLCLAPMNLLLSVAAPSSRCVTMAVSIPHWVVKSDRLSLDDDRPREEYYYEALAFSRHSINLELDEEIMEPEKAAKAPRNSGIDPSTMKMKLWYEGQDRLSDKSQWKLPSNRVSDKST